MVQAGIGLCTVSLTVLAPLCVAFTDTRAPDRYHSIIPPGNNAGKLAPNNPGLSTWKDMTVHPKTDDLHKKGLFKLNNYTMAKLVSLAINADGHGLLVRFYADQTVPHDDDEFDPMYPMIDKLNHFHGLSLGELSVPYADDYYKDHGRLRELYGIEDETLPTYVLFSKEYPTGIHYHGNEKYDDIAVWLHVHCGFEIEHETIEDMNKLVRAFMKTQDAAILNKAMLIATESGHSMSIYYPKYMHKLQEKGTGWIKKEQARIQMMLKQKVPHDARSELSDKMKVLGVFSKVAKELGAEL